MVKKKKNKDKNEKQGEFAQDLEKYTYKKIGALHLRWELVGLVVVLVVIGVSVMEGYYSASPLFGAREEIEKYAASQGDYESLQEIASRKGEMKVLGVETELDESIYPEIKLEKELEQNSILLQQYPDSRDLLLRQAVLLEQIGDIESSKYFEEQARLLDPNNQLFKNRN